MGDWISGFVGKNKGFYDMGYDKGCWMSEVGFWVDFVGDLGDLGKGGF